MRQIDTIELKEILTAYKNNDFQMDGSVNISELTTAMLGEIGNIDPVLRDELIYSSFCQLILHGFYSNEELKDILNICTDNEHLFYEIGEVETDSVFTRSFSSLVIAVILNVNLQKSFLSSDQKEEVSTLLVKYLDQEQDVRGLVQEKGWAHSMAHVADALDELVKQPCLPAKTLEVIFHAIFDKMTFNKDYFHHDEEERLVVPVIALLQRGLNESMVCGKIADLTHDIKKNFSSGDHPYFVYRANIKQFLGSLYFHLDHKEQNVEIQHSIKQGLREINQPYFQM